MSHYIGCTGQAVIKPEYRNELEHLFNCEFDRLTCGIFLEYLHEYYGEELKLNQWESYWYNDMFEGIKPTLFDKDTGMFSFGVTFNMMRSEVYMSIAGFLDLLGKISEEEPECEYWDESDSPDAERYFKAPLL